MYGEPLILLPVHVYIQKGTTSNLLIYTVTSHCMPQKQTLHNHPLPQISTFRERLSLQGQGMHLTRGLGPHHPLIRGWHHKKLRRANSSSPSPSQLTRHTQSFSEPTTEVYSEHVIDKSQLHRGDVVVCNKYSNSTLSESQNIALPVMPSIERGKTQRKTTHALPMEQSGNNSATRHSSVPSAQPQCSATLPCITSSQLTTTSTDGHATDCKRGLSENHTSVYFTDGNQMRGSQLPCESSSSLDLHTSCDVLTSTSASQPSSSDFRGSHPHTSSFSRGMSSGDRLVSSLGCLGTDRGIRGRELITSLPSLPHIHSTTVCDRPSPTGTTHTSCQRSGSSNRSCTSAIQARRERRKSGRRCSIINLRIPFGKVEEWDVPQDVRSREEEEDEEEEEGCSTGGGEGETTSEDCQMKTGDGHKDSNPQNTSSIGIVYTCTT